MMGKIFNTQLSHKVSKDKNKIELKEHILWSLLLQ